MLVRGLWRFAKNHYGPRLDKRGVQVFYSTVISQNTVPEQTSNHETTYGQPTSMTHPHLLKHGELLPGITLKEFRERREKLKQRILMDEYVLKNPGNSHIIIIPSSSVVYMSDKIPYVFRQNTDFLYFSGCQEPDSILVMVIHGDKLSTHIFLRKKDQHSELWDGPRTGVDAAAELFDVDQALANSDFEQFLLAKMKENKKTSVWYDNSQILQADLHRKLRNIVAPENQALISPKKLFHQIRLIKSESEINLMKKSCDIASTAIAKTIKVSKPNMTEHHLFATIDYHCRMNGAEFLAYPPVVASGSNTNVIHYIKNNQVVRDGAIVLMDAGCEYHGYSSDITRTWPISGTFTPHQRTLYEIVLEVQKILISRLKNMPTLDQVFHEMCDLLGQRLQQIGIIPPDLSAAKLRAAAFTFCPHHVSHYLGMDVHDTGMIPRSVRLKPGMIITVEPGIYVSHQNLQAPPEFRGLGIRIEDDVLIQDNEPSVLTASCPKEILEIENLAKRNQTSLGVLKGDRD